MLKLHPTSTSSITINDLDDKIISLLKRNILKTKLFFISKHFLMFLLLIILAVILHHHLSPIVNSIMWFLVGWKLGKLLEHFVMRNFIKIDNIKKFKPCLLSVDYQNLIQKYYFNNEKASIRDVQKILHKYETQLL